MKGINIRTFPREELQRAIGCHSLREVLHTLRVRGLIAGYRLHDTKVIIRSTRTLELLFTFSDDPS